MFLSDMKREVVNKVYTLLGDFERKTGIIINNVPVIEFSKRGTTAGTCEYNFQTGEGILNFNPEIMRDNFDVFIDRTVAHEVAHYITDRVYGLIMRGSRVSHHGKEWKRTMRILGVKDIKRCHSYRVDNISRRKTKKFQYECDCGIEHVVSTVTHNRMQRGHRSYVCVKCHSKLSFVRRIR